ncbi:MAG: transposase [Fimbriiglobus sp.]|nr:transposase [Fimbriiglobus sp.]
MRDTILAIDLGRYKSGSSVRKRTRMSKAGNTRLQKGLILSTQTAVRFNPTLASCYLVRRAFALRPATPTDAAPTVRRRGW